MEEKGDLKRREQRKKKNARNELNADIGNVNVAIPPVRVHNFNQRVHLLCHLCAMMPTKHIKCGNCSKIFCEIHFYDSYVTNNFKTYCCQKEYVNLEAEPELDDIKVKCYFGIVNNCDFKSTINDVLMHEKTCFKNKEVNFPTESEFDEQKSSKDSQKCNIELINGIDDEEDE